jgi:dTDP-4-amino-4,6-dideoxygalactose transaminase
VYLCDIGSLEHLSARRRIPLLFDSVEACGSVYNGRSIGSFGNCEVFSMHPSTVLNSGEGGYITTNDDGLAAVLRSTRAFGFVKKDDIQYLGHNAKMNELHAALGLASLSRVNDVLRDNETLHKAYQKNLTNLPGFTCLPYETHEKRNWRSLLIRLDERWPFTRSETLALLNAENIHARAYYGEPQHRAYHALMGGTPPHLPVADRAAQHHLILPFGHTVSVADTEIIAEVLRDMYGMRHVLKDALRGRHEKSC